MMLQFFFRFTWPETLALQTRKDMPAMSTFWMQLFRKHVHEYSSVFKFIIDVSQNLRKIKAI